ncbi:MAG: ATP-binding protein, partial [Lachnospiraceae bacterium]|nr:ATP-binding protein [Lachnospiraceae bacterium]
VDNYIYILNVRFTGDISYQKEVEADIGDMRVPSMILQPIVENAVQHGIHDCMENGRITLSVRRVGTDTLEIRVSDNGVGMTQEQIQSILECRAVSDDSNSHSTGVAMSNVIHRLELYYDRQNLLRIESGGPGRGTQVILSLPTGD